MTVLQGASGTSAPDQVVGSMQMPSMAASVHDSVNTVGSAAMSKAILQAQAQAQAYGMGSQVFILACNVTSAISFCTLAVNPNSGQRHREPWV